MKIVITVLGAFANCLLMGAALALTPAQQAVLFASKPVSAPPPVSNPSAICGANLVGWYKADVGVGASSWADQSGNGYTMAPNGYNMPATSTLGGKPSLVFLSNNAQLRTTADTVAIGTGGAYSLFMLASTTANSATAGPAVGANGEYTNISAGPHSLMMATNNTSFYAVHASGTYGGGTISINTEQRYGMVLDGVGNVTMYINNAVIGATSSIPVFSTTTPGTLSAMGGNGDGNVREIVYCNKALNSTQLAAMDAYLASRQ